MAVLREFFEGAQEFHCAGGISITIEQRMSLGKFLLSGLMWVFRYEQMAPHLQKNGQDDWPDKKTN